MAPSLHPSPPMADADNNKLLQELDALSQSLYQAHIARRTASLALPRSSDGVDHSQPANTRRLSMSPFHSRPQPESIPSGPPFVFSEAPTNTEKKGIWSWKPLRAISHIGKHRLSILFSVEVVAIQYLPTSMNGLRLSISVRKKESKEGAVKTMPARVLLGTADFDETLFIKSHVYCSGGRSTGKPLRFEPRIFVISPIAVDAPELDFGRSSIDLSLLVIESMEKSIEGSRIRQWDTVYKLSGKAKGGELVIKLGFQIMEDGGVAIYGQGAEVSSISSSKGLGDSSSFARRHSKSSFSISSPKAKWSAPSAPSPSKEGNSALELKGIEEFNLDEDPSPKSQLEPEAKAEDLELPEFDIVDKGIEISFGGEEAEVASDQALASSEVVKEVVHDNVHSLRLSELDSIANQIKALESMMINEEVEELPPVGKAQELDPEEETATREFLHMLELEGAKEIANYSLMIADKGPEEEEKSYLSDLGRGLGSVVHTRDGGYLTSMNPFNVEIPKKETPKLAMQISRPIIIDDPKPSAGFEVFQKVSAMGLEELGSKLLSLASMDELTGKTAEQIAFEGIASVIVSGRKKEMATSTAAKSVAVLKSMAKAMNEGRKERILTGIWNVREEPLTSMEDILSFSLQKIETMAVEGLKVEAGMPEQEAPFDVSPITESNGSLILHSALTLEDWLKKGNSKAEGVILLVLVQLRDPVRRFEAVGAPMIGMVQAARVGGGQGGKEGFKVGSLHVGGMKMRLGRKRSVWDGERQRLMAMQWLVAYGVVKGGRKRKVEKEKGGKDLIWSLSARVMADMWLMATRNPDVRLPDL